MVMLALTGNPMDQPDLTGLGTVNILNAFSVVYKLSVFKTCLHYMSCFGTLDYSPEC